MSGAAMAVLALLLHAMLLAAVAPALAGMRARVAAQVGGGAGPEAGQAWLDLRRLWRKRPAVPAAASPLFRAGPAVAVGAAGLAAVLTPSFALDAAAAPGADLLAVFGLLALARGALAVAGRDAGPGSGHGMGVAVASGPALGLVAMAAVLLSGGTNLAAVAAAVRDGGVAAHGAGALAGAALFLLLLAEPPLPEQGFAGRMRALALGAEMLRVLVVLLVVADLALPFGVAPVGAGLDGWAVGAAFAVLKLGALGMAAAALQRRLPPAGLQVAAALLALGAVVAAGVQGPA